MKTIPSALQLKIPGAVAAPLALALLTGTLVAQDSAPAIAPAEVINLMSDPEFKDFTHFLNADKSVTTDRDDIWSIADNGQLQVSGRGWGYLRTNRKYRDYHLVLEYKWGERTWGSRADRARDCGLLVHGFGEDGGFGDTWINSIEAQLIEGGSGDILVLAYQPRGGEKAPTSLTCQVQNDRDGEPVWTPGGEARTFPPQDKMNGRINWRDRDPDWADVKGFRGAKDIENPVGEWNRMEVICEGDSVRILLNGEVVNEGTKANPSEGFVCLQSEMAECWIRRYELHPLGKFTEAWKPQAGTTDMGYSITGESLLPRRLPLGAEESGRLWEIDGDYELQLVAAEPLTCDPVDVVWDAQGRMFVAEMRDYPLPAEGGSFLSRIRLLKDKNGDGIMDQAVTWADELDHVQGLLPMQDGLLATTRTAILFLKDTDGDDVADEIRTLFRSNEPRHNQLQVSCPRWGLDNAIYLNNGLDGKEIYPEDHPEVRLDFTRLNLRYDPRTNQMTTVSGAGQFGAAQDDFGRRFFCSNRNPVMFAVMPLEAVKRNPLAGITQGHEDIQEPGGPVWPVALSHTTSAAHAGTHTAACGLGVYRGDLMPDLRGNVFVCDPTAQLVTRNRLEPRGASFTAQRIGDKRDFLVSGDEWSRPVNVRNGPDGAFYVCDMYRQFIDHARFFPEDFSASHYMRAGVDQGRIWRLAPKGATPQAPAPLPDSGEQLVELLESKIAWQRIHAQRLLVERGDTSVAAALTGMLTRAALPVSRVHAMWTLQGLGALRPADVAALLADNDPGVVENALLAASSHFAADPEIRRIATGMITHTDPRVRFLSVSLFPPAEGEGSPAAFARMLKDSPQDPWIRRAVMSAAGNLAGPILADLLMDPKFVAEEKPGRADTLQELASLTAANGRIDEIAAAIDHLEGRPAWWHFSVATGLSEGLRRSPLKQKTLAALLARAPEGFAASAARLQALLENASELAMDTSRAAGDRIAALPLVAQQGLEKALPVVEKMIATAETAEIQAAACRSLSRFDREEVAAFFFDRWDSLAPAPLREALALITGNTKSGLLLMKKMKAGKINPSLMPPDTRWSYGRSQNEEIKALALELFGKPSGDRAQVIADYRTGLSANEGDALRGKEVFQKAACITCHRMGDLGVDVGPALADVRIKPAEALLTDILDPNRAVEERWVSAVLETKDGRVLTGLVAGDDASAVTLKIPGGLTEAVPRSEIAKFGVTGFSLMPVGLEAAISKQEMTDLIAYLKAR